MPFGPALRATVIGFGANAMLPGRVGEVVRPYLLARKANLDPTATFATIVLERALDIITLLLLFAVRVALLEHGFAVNDGQMLRAVQFGGLVAAAAALSGSASPSSSPGTPSASPCHRTSHASPAGPVGRLASRSWRRSGRDSRSFVAGGAAPAFAWSVAVWLSIALTTWAMARAFGLPLTVSAPSRC